MKTFDDFGIDLRGRSGVEVKTLCPQCSHARKKKNYPCLNVNTEKGVWHCWHCEWAGSLSSGVEQKPQWYMPREYKKPQYVAPIAIDNAGIRWLKSRGITEDVIDRAKIGYGKVYMPQVEEEVDAVQFPYFRNGECINIKYRQVSEKNFRMYGGAERILYGLDDIGSEVIFVEGEVDKLSCAVAGYWSCVSVPDGAPAISAKDYQAKFSFLDSAAERLEAVERFILATDVDAPGVKLRGELARRLGKERCYVVEWPEGCKDANEVLAKHGVNALKLAIQTAKPMPLDGVVTVADIRDRADLLFREGVKHGLSTGWASLDALYTIRTGEWTVVTGVPNSGKSNWVDDLAVNLAKEHKWKFAVFSPENFPIEDHALRYAEKYMRKPLEPWRLGHMTREEKDLGLDWVAHHFRWILPDEDADWSIGNVLAIAKTLVVRHGINGLIIDPWNELDHSRSDNLTETEYVSVSLKKLRQFARRHDVHIWLVAHPTKLYRDKEGKYPIPTLYDISGSAHFRNKSDNGLCVWRDLAEEHDNAVHIYVQKIRFRQVGRIGSAVLAYDASTGTYSQYQGYIPPMRSKVKQ